MAGGFTLPELLVALAIIAVLAVTAVPHQLASKAPLDPWGRPYEFLSFATLDNSEKGRMRNDRNVVPISTDYDLYSRGPDGDTRPPLNAQPSHDDIVRANDGGYIGKADDY